MTSLLDKAYDPENFRLKGHELVDLLADYLAEARRGDSNMPVLPNRDPEEMFRKYRALLTDEPELSVHDFFGEVLNDCNHIHHPRYVGHQVCAPAPLGAVAGLAATLLNNGSAVFEMGPANTAMERVVLKLTAEALGYPDGADGVMTSGGSLGNLTALLGARKAKSDPEDPRPMAFLVSEASHYSNQKSLRIMGFEDRAIIPVAVDEVYRIDPGALEPTIAKAEQQGFRVIGMIANACTTGTGTYDDLPRLADFCRQRDLWLHVDGAHGVAPIFSERYRNLLKGIDQADSVVIDYHKMLLAPGLITAVLFRNGSDSYRTFAEKASYLWSREDEKEWFNFSKRTIECTKLMMGLKVFTVLKAYGAGLYSEYVDKVYGLAREFAELIRRTPGFELAQEPESNIVCFRLVVPGLAPEELDNLNARIRQRIVESGEYYIVQVQLKKGLFLRTALMNPFTGLDDLKRLLELVAEWRE